MSSSAVTAVVAAAVTTLATVVRPVILLVVPRRISFSSHSAIFSAMSSTTKFTTSTSAEFMSDRLTFVSARARCPVRLIFANLPVVDSASVNSSA